MPSTFRGRCVSRYMRLPRLSLNPGLLFRKLRIGCALLAPCAAAGRRRAASKSGSRAVVDPLLSSYYKNDVWGLFLAPGTSSLIRASPAARIPDFAPSGHQTVRGVSTLPSTFRGRHVSRKHGSHACHLIRASSSGSVAPLSQFCVAGWLAC